MNGRMNENDLDPLECDMISFCLCPNASEENRTNLMNLKEFELFIEIILNGQSEFAREGGREKSFATKEVPGTSRRDLRNSTGIFFSFLPVGRGGG